MPEFCQISFDENELEAIRLACEMQSEAEDTSLDESASGDIEGVVVQEVKADDMLLIKQTVRIFKPGQKILITPEDLKLVRQSLENFLDAADYALTDAINSAIAKIDGCKPHKE
jgi:RNase P/RNase MRP subunit p30